MEEVDRQAIIRVKQQLGSLFRPNMWIYWTDLLLSAGVGWSALIAAVHLDSVALIALCLLIATFALYRALVFTHELEHQPAGALPGFRFVWHLLCGMPFCLPHFLYRGVHRIHHSSRYYGTPDDPEYMPFVTKGTFQEPIRFLVLSFAFPLTIALRYLVLAPASLFSKRMRTWVVTKASAFVMKMDYARKPPEGAELTIMRLEEASTTLFVWSVVVAIALGVLPPIVLLYWYIVVAGSMLANTVRGLYATHRYESSGEVLAFEDHIYDSVNLQQRWSLSFLIGPLGLWLHATHHIFPTLPYYALWRAHVLLMQEAAREDKPLQFYVSGQWGNVPASMGRLHAIIRSYGCATLQKNPRENLSLRNVSSAAKSSEYTRSSPPIGT